MKTTDEKLKAICTKVGKGNIEILAEYALGYCSGNMYAMEECFNAILDLGLDWSEAEYVANCDCSEIREMANHV